MPLPKSLSQLLLTLEPPVPWAEGDNIPWHEPAFSARMLQQHLDQSHDRASRRLYIVDRHVAWLQEYVLPESAATILDLGCGPGLYCHRLARLGHHCTGIDYSPASIAYARQQVEEDPAAATLNCHFIEGDIRTTDYPGHNDLVMLLFGELNVFRPRDAALLLDKARAALRPGGRLIIEAHTRDAIRRLGEGEQIWYVARSGLFSERPHLVLTQPTWHASDCVATLRYLVVELETGAVQHYAQSLQAYTIEEYQTLLQTAGFDDIETLPGLTEDVRTADPDFLVLAARG